MTHDARTVLPIPDRPAPGPAMYEATHEGASYEPLRQLRPPVDWVDLAVIDDDREADGLITAEDRMRVAPTVQ